jgi:hypothetical protein
MEEAQNTWLPGTSVRVFFYDGEMEKYEEGRAKVGDRIEESICHVCALLQDAGAAAALSDAGVYGLLRGPFADAHSSIPKTLRLDAWLQRHD